MPHSHWEIPQTPEPLWRTNTDIPSFPSIKENLSCDAAIVGGGITGITTAYLLAKEGLKVILIEADHLINGTTGHTTAKITVQHDLIYDELISHFGIERAKQYYSGNQEGFDFIKETISSLGIECDYLEQDSYLYATTKQTAKKLKKEYEAYRKLGIPCELVDSIPLELMIECALKVPNQAQFHPVKYTTALLKAFLELGGSVYEQSPAKDVKKEGKMKVITKSNHVIECSHVISCSHFPFVDKNGLYFTRMHADRSYVLSLKAKKEYPGGMYLSADEPKHP